jgi:hypothetical protein
MDRRATAAPWRGSRVAVLEAREKPSTYSSRRPGRQVPTMVDQVVSFRIATDDVIETVPLLAW